MKKKLFYEDIYLKLSVKDFFRYNFYIKVKVKLIIFI